MVCFEHTQDLKFNFYNIKYTLSCDFKELKKAFANKCLKRTPEVALNVNSSACELLTDSRCVYNHACKLKLSGKILLNKNVYFWLYLRC